MGCLTGGAALIGGTALLLAGPGGVSALESNDDVRRPVTIEYELVSCDSVLPLTCGAGGLFGGSQALSFNADWNPGGAFLGLIGPGGLLIGNGLDGTDAYVDENGVFHAATAGGAGGLLWGNGGRGGNGLSAGVYEVYDPDTDTVVSKWLDATDGANGGRGGLLFGNGGNGGNGGSVGVIGSPVSAGLAGGASELVAGNGGNGGRAGLLFGVGGNGGNGGESNSSYADAIGGNGGNGGGASLGALLGLTGGVNGGNGGNG
ncbi:hypothetical protein MPHL43070_23695, partial [Mycolicibacterium phlei DSM 43070]